MQEPLKKLPDFTSEEEERDFYEQHGVTGYEGDEIITEPVERPARTRDKVTFRLSEELVPILEDACAKTGEGPSTWVRTLVEGELKKLQQYL